MPYPYSYNNPYSQLLSYQQQAVPPVQPVSQPAVQPSPLFQYPNQRVLVDGPAEAMNRFLMRYPAHMLTPGFISDELFDVNGKQFHVLSVEADGRRHLETFDFHPHVEEQPVNIDGAQFVSRQEFEDFTAKVNAALGALNGVHATVPTTGTATQPGRVNDAGQDQHAQELGRGQLAGTGGAAVPVQ